MYIAHLWGQQLKSDQGPQPVCGATNWTDQSGWTSRPAMDLGPWVKVALVSLLPSTGALVGVVSLDHHQDQGGLAGE